MVCCQLWAHRHQWSVHCLSELMGRPHHLLRACPRLWGCHLLGRLAQQMVCCWGWQTVLRQLAVCRLAKPLGQQMVLCLACQRGWRHRRLEVCHLVSQKTSRRWLRMVWQMACCLGWMALGCQC